MTALVRNTFQGSAFIRVAIKVPGMNAGATNAPDKSGFMTDWTDQLAPFTGRIVSPPIHRGVSSFFP
jgi:hypothetical protein